MISSFLSRVIGWLVLDDVETTMAMVDPRELRVAFVNGRVNETVVELGLLFFMLSLLTIFLVRYWKDIKSVFGLNNTQIHLLAAPKENLLPPQ